MCCVMCITNTGVSSIQFTQRITTTYIAVCYIRNLYIYIHTTSIIINILMYTKLSQKKHKRWFGKIFVANIYL